jgi:nicotinamidase-related amidase
VPRVGAKNSQGRRVPGTSGSQLAPGIVEDADCTLKPDTLLRGGLQAIRPGEVIIYKPRCRLPDRARGPLRAHEDSTVVVCGCNFPNCPRTSIYEARECDFRVVLADDAVSGTYGNGREKLRSIGVSLMPTAKLIEATAPIAAVVEP